MEFEIKDHSDAQDLLFLFASRLRAALTYRRDRVGLDGYTSALFLYRLMRETKITSRIIAICHLRSWPVTIPSIITDAFLMFYVAQSSNTAGDASLLNLETTEDDKSRILETYYDQWWSASTDEKKWSNDGNTWSMDAALKVYRQQIAKSDYPEPSPFFDRMEDVISDLLNETKAPDYNKVLEQINELEAAMAKTRIV